MVKNRPFGQKWLHNKQAMLRAKGAVSPPEGQAKAWVSHRALLCWLSNSVITGRCSEAIRR
jgi:hypothetical protein